MNSARRHTIAAIEIESVFIWTTIVVAFETGTIVLPEFLVTVIWSADKLSVVAD